ncbi:hypothetical protein AB1Y20_023176 [Prymnesium parvum]|uniref:CRAL-TRIO domain-containing protein n=1 Tax=Prymnesium parvum TaxID=97485 RepID=A0AB34JDC6_PRYPA
MASDQASRPPPHCRVVSYRLVGDHAEYQIQTCAPTSAEVHVTASRRYNDFKALHRQLRLRQLSPPPLPPPGGRRNLESRFLNERVGLLDSWLSRACASCSGEHVALVERFVAVERTCAFPPPAPAASDAAVCRESEGERARAESLGACAAPPARSPLAPPRLRAACAALPTLQQLLLLLLAASCMALVSGVAAAVAVAAAVLGYSSAVSGATPSCDERSHDIAPERGETEGAVLPWEAAVAPPTKDPSEAAKLHEIHSLRQLLEEDASWVQLPLCAKAFATDAILYDYLETSGHSPARARQRLLATMQWRQARELDAPELPRCSSCDADPTSHCCFSLGADLRGWEAIYLCPGRARDKDPDRGLRHLWITLESVLRRAPDSGRVVMLVDLNGFSLRDLDPRTGLRCIPAILSHHCGRVCQFALLSPPRVFKVIYNMIAPVCPSWFLEKVHLLKGKAAQSYCERYLTPKQVEFLHLTSQLPPRPGFLPARTASPYPEASPNGPRKSGRSHG